MRKFLWAGCGLVFALLSIDASAWSSPGHQLVGQVAENLIQGHQAEIEVHKILQGGSMHDNAIWADCARNVQFSKTLVKGSHFVYSKKSFYDHRCAVFDGTQEGINEFISYVSDNYSNCVYAGAKTFCHKAFHFADIPYKKGSYSSDFPGASNYDVVHALQMAIGILKGKAAPKPFVVDTADKLLALRLLIHFAGDMHQPLHVGAVYLDKNGNIVMPKTKVPDPATNNAGGNELWLTETNDPTKVGSTELHSVWDGIPDGFSSTDSVAKLADLAKPYTQNAGPINKAIETWASDTVVGAGKAYADVKFQAFSTKNPKGKGWPISFSDPNYTKDREALQWTQIAKGGGRLAAILMDIWPDK